ncbi:MAG: hypothetical protein BJ554DRAFT_1457 [Olpidium bornovanus]|uniref:RNA helicase n=1 Tax=Olpidium bornovanus TaxID=278681 RepID=A0A8H8A1A0_9FUNG|nr:MAG: hypothetical protein BJ554DRAFT_1457 [Olpidium bornovanus]
MIKMKATNLRRVSFLVLVRILNLPDSKRDDHNVRSGFPVDRREYFNNFPTEPQVRSICDNVRPDRQSVITLLGDFPEESGAACPAGNRLACPDSNRGGGSGQRGRLADRPHTPRRQLQMGLACAEVGGIRRRVFDSRSVAITAVDWPRSFPPSPVAGANNAIQTAERRGRAGRKSKIQRFRLYVCASWLLLNGIRGNVRHFTAIFHSSSATGQYGTSAITSFRYSCAQTWQVRWMPPGGGRFHSPRRTASFGALNVSVRRLSSWARHQNVVNFDVARDVDAHTHRVGRTGRAGEKGTAHVLLTEKEDRFAAELVKNFEGSGLTITEELMALAMKKIPFSGGLERKVSETEAVPGRARRTPRTRPGTRYAFYETAVAVLWQSEILTLRPFDR